MNKNWSFLITVHVHSYWFYRQQHMSLSLLHTSKERLWWSHVRIWILTILIACIATTIGFPQIIQVNNNTFSFPSKTWYLDKKYCILLLASTSIKLGCDAFNIENEGIGRGDVKWSICAKIKIMKKKHISFILLSDLYFSKGIVWQYFQ